MFNLTRGEELTALIGVVLVGAATATVCLTRGDKRRAVEIPVNNEEDESVQREGEGEGKTIVLYVTGEVERKGVLELKSGSRVKDALAMARPTQNADLDAMNLAAFVVDGEQIIVPRKSAVERVGTLPARPGSPAKINVNLASQQELESLPGVGPIIAQRIIEFRKRRTFQKVDDLLEVRGIGPKTLERIKDRVSVR